MTSRLICLLLLAVVACGNTAAQVEDELHIPVEDDNQFPPDSPPDSALPLDEGLIEGSGVGVLELPSDNKEVTTESAAPLEDIEPANNVIAMPVDTVSCPQSCVCHTEGEANELVVDCSGYGLTEFPAHIDPETIVLNIQNNKLTEIPKEISNLKKLRTFNAENNSIMELTSGSISELTELVVLNLANNRLIEYPKDLKNSFGLTKLEELNLGGNDIRQVTADNFASFKSLKILTLPTSTEELNGDLCASLKETLTTICTESCKNQAFECPDAPEQLENDLLNAVLPGMIALTNTLNDTEDENADPNFESSKLNEDNVTEESPQIIKTLNEAVNSNAPVDSSSSDDKTKEYSFKTAVNELPQETGQLNVAISGRSGNLEPVETGEEKENVGATTTQTSKSGGVSKSVIGFVVAGMVVVIAGITIKKNWSSIKTRFSSTPRPANERGANGMANGTTPEEIPLQQDKSPV